MKKRTIVVTLIALSVIGAPTAFGQTPAHDPSDRLREVLPADVAERVLSRIAAARSRGLPDEAIANRALKFTARGVNPRDVERSVVDHVARLDRAKAALDTVRARGRRADAAEIEAGAEAIRLGVDGSKVSELARSAPSSRSLAVPLFVIGSLVDRGLPSDDALRRVLERMQRRASDRDLERLPDQVARRGSPAETGRAAGAANRPPQAGGAPGAARGGRPETVPANPGSRGRPENPGRGRP